MVPSTTRITDVPMTTASTTIETSSEYCFHLSQRGRQVPLLEKKASLQFNTVLGFDISVVELFNFSVGHSWDETDQRTHSDFTDHCYCIILPVVPSEIVELFIPPSSESTPCTACKKDIYITCRVEQLKRPVSHTS